MTLNFSYGTNGFRDHSLTDTLQILRDLNYRGVGITLDHGFLNPFDSDIAAQTERVANLLESCELQGAIETGARYLLDPRQKHEPTLVSAANTQKRVDFLRRAVDIAHDLGLATVHLWSGVLRDDISPESAWDRILSNLDPVVAHAADRGVTLAFEPEPGMFIERFRDFQTLAAKMGNPENLQATIDVGHAICNEDADIYEYLTSTASVLRHVQIEDMRRGVHEHLEFGEGELNLNDAISALVDIEYSGLVSVELARHSHDAPQVARRSIETLSRSLEAVLRQKDQPEEKVAT